MINISIKNDFSGDYITRVAGEKLRKIILEADLKNQKIEINFSGVTIASTSFFDEGFAKLNDSGWTMEKLKTQIILKNIKPKDHYVLLEMCKNRGMK
ncbi:MAG: STAS-like domain-containing protein [Deltaproteobacteria bacterium]|nr:STAS-like domain-containing protein [Deltaproteobacteria bacterium]